MEAVSNTKAAQLLVISSQFDQINKLLSNLRVHGLQLKAFGTDTLKELNQRLCSRRCDLVIFDLNSPLCVQQAIQVLTISGLELPLIILTDSRPKQLDKRLLRGPVQDIIAFDDESHIHFAIRREVDKQTLKTRHRLLQLSHRELDKRHQALLDNTPQALAYILEGMHLYCNQNYAELFAAESPALLERTPVLDLFNGTQRDRLKLLLSATITEEKQIVLELADNKLSLVFSPSASRRKIVCSSLLEWPTVMMPTAKNVDP